MSCKCGWGFESPITLLLTGVPSFQKILPLRKSMHMHKLVCPSDLYVTWCMSCLDNVHMPHPISSLLSSYCPLQLPPEA